MILTGIVGSGAASILYFKINTTTGVADWTDIKSKCNEETHILINDQAWSTQELGGISGSGTVATDCRAMVEIVDGKEKLGAILR